MPERRESRLVVLVSICLVLLLCVLLSGWAQSNKQEKALDRLGDRLTAAIASEVHSEMWNQIRQNDAEQSEERRRLETELRAALDTQSVIILTWRENVIRKHPDLGDKK